MHVTDLCEAGSSVPLARRRVQGRAWGVVQMQGSVGQRDPQKTRREKDLGGGRPELATTGLSPHAAEQGRAVSDKTSAGPVVTSLTLPNSRPPVL